MVSTLRQIYSVDKTVGFGNAEAIPHNRPAATLINRDVSLIEFFRRVLDEGLDTSQPVLERLKFLAIFSTNLDEFFQIRVSGLKEKLGREVGASPDGLTLNELLAEIRTSVLELSDTQINCLRSEILPELRTNKIVVESYAELADEEKAALDEHFRKKIYPVLTPQAVDPTHPFPYISGGSLNLALIVRPKLNKRVARALKQTGEEFFVRIKIPAFVPRFVPVGDETERFVLAEELIAANVHMFAPESKPENCHIFRITRDADIDLREAEANDLLESMEQNLKARRFGDVVRLEVSKSMPQDMVDYLIESLEITGDDVYAIDGPINIADFWALIDINRPDLKSRPFEIRKPRVFDLGQSTFDLIKQNDILLHHPYMPYSIITDFIREAVEDPDVLAIKICLYRIGEDSPIAPLLIEASERGKQVTALIEIKARFDEANNIEWGKRLERAGVHVVYGLLGLKTHAKTTLIVRREGDELKRYVHLATGNYNPATSTVYTDLGLLTVDDEIGADVLELFNYLTVYSPPSDIQKLLIAPLNLRDRMTEMIERESENARNGKPASIIAKINRLADSEIVNKLYEASQAGVQIDLIVRGICTLRPGVPGLSENIRVRSIVGRLLEHSRIYYFENGGTSEIYIGSSDWMPRNLDRRVEVLAPIRNGEIKRFLTDEYLASYLRDNVKARELTSDGRYRRLSANNGDEPFDAQTSFQHGPRILSFGTRH